MRCAARNVPVLPPDCLPGRRGLQSGSVGPQGAQFAVRGWPLKAVRPRPGPAAPATVRRTRCRRHRLLPGPAAPSARHRFTGTCRTMWTQKCSGSDQSRALLGRLECRAYYRQADSEPVTDLGTEHYCVARQATPAAGERTSESFRPLIQPPQPACTRPPKLWAGMELSQGAEVRISDVAGGRTEASGQICQGARGAGQRSRGAGEGGGWGASPLRGPLARGALAAKAGRGRTRIGPGRDRTSVV